MANVSFILIFVPAILFIALFFIVLVGTRKKDKHRFANKNIDVTRMTKRFTTIKGRQVVAFERDAFGEPHREAAILLRNF